MGGDADVSERSGLIARDSIYGQLVDGYAVLTRRREVFAKAVSLYCDVFV